MSDFVTEPDKVLAAINADLTDARLRNDRAKSELQKTEAQLKDSRAMLTRWNRRVAALEKFIETTPTLTALGEVKDFDQFKTTGKDLASKFGDADVTFVDAETGKPTTVKLKDEIADLLDDARALRAGDDEAGSILAGLKDIVKPDAPGLVVTVAALARDMAEAERARTAARLAALERRKAVADRMIALRDQATLLVEGARNAIAETSRARPTLPQERIAQTLAELARDRQPAAQDLLANAMSALQNYLAVAGPLTARLREAQRDDAYLSHVHSIEISRVAVDQHQALIARGLEGVAAYHAGGFKPEQVADLVHKAVQLILLGVIAGGI
jgi:hypothetical protein